MATPDHQASRVKRKGDRESLKGHPWIAKMIERLIIRWKWSECDLSWISQGGLVRDLAIKRLLGNLEGLVSVN